MLYRTLITLCLSAASAQGSWGLTLEDAQVAAAIHSPALQAQRERAIQVGTLRGKAYSALSPSVDATATYILNDREISFDPTSSVPSTFSSVLPSSDPVVIQQKQSWRGEVSVSQWLYNGTAVPLLNVAYNLTRAANEDVELAAQAVRAQVASTYWSTMIANRRVEAADASMSVATAEVALVEARASTGEVPHSAVLQGKVQLSLAARELSNSRTDLVQQQERFFALTGLREQSLDLPPPLEVPSTLDDALSDARYARSDIKAASYRTEALFYQRTAKDLQWMPTISGRAAYVYDQNTGFSGDPFSWRATVTGSWRLWDGGLKLAERREIESQLRTSRQTEDQLLDLTAQEVRVAWYSHQAGLDAVAAAAWQQELAAESVRMARASRDAGQVTDLDVQRAVSSALAVNVAGLADHMSLYMAAVELRRAMGTL